jgi:hypothetical protein
MQPTLACPSAAVINPPYPAVQDRERAAAAPLMAAVGRAFVTPLVFFFIVNSWDGVSAGQPAVQIDIGTAA